ncbi:MAG: hypothetical protein ACOYOA_05690 [Saprospiraceae bacterium]
MTLRDFFALLAQNPLYILFFFAMIPFAAWLANLLGKDEGNVSPWNYFYAALLYMICIPGIFSVTLSLYVFLFEKRSIFETDVYTQILPVISMISTIFIVKRNAELNLIPGFGKLSGLITMISAALIFMWIIDRTHIFVFSYMRIEYVLLIFAVLLFAIRITWSNIIK